MVGGLVVILLLIANSDCALPLDRRLLSGAGLSLGGGRNVVNVIVVDFRGYDTMGEITVLTIAAIGVHPDQTDTEPATTMSSLILTTVTRLVFFVVLLFSSTCYYEGITARAGFIARVMTALGFCCRPSRRTCGTYVRVFRREPRLLAGIGLLTSLSTGLVPMLFGYPFLTSTFGHLHTWLGDVELASAFFFDLGVYFVVVGGTLLMIMTLAEA